MCVSVCDLVVGGVFKMKHSENISTKCNGWTFFKSCFEQTHCKINLWNNWEDLKMDWVLDDHKGVLLTLLGG